MISDDDLINQLLNDEVFRKKVESELGDSIKVTVNWEENYIDVKGKHSGKRLAIDETLAVLKGRMQ